jgi:hypothetical protein
MSLIFLSKFVLIEAADKKDENYLKVRFLRDLVEIQNKPTRIVLWKNCFNHEELIDLMRNSLTSISLNQKESLAATDYNFDIQYWMFVVDFACHDTLTAVEKVICTFFC